MARRLPRSAALLATAALAAAGLVTPASATAGSATSQHPTAPPITHLARGTVVKARPLKHSLWIPGTTKRAYKLTYVTSNTFGKPALSTGEVFIPRGKAPRGGWPLISWAHGTSGLGDDCAPSIHGPSERHRDFSYLHNWMKAGYAVVASDYAGLGTAGLQAYLDGRTEAHNVVDMVAAGRAFARTRLPRTQQLSSRWVVIGQSQGGGAAVYTARYATRFGGRSLHYLGAVATGSPAYIENLVKLFGPEAPPAPISDINTAYLSEIIAALRYARPQLKIDAILNAKGRAAVRDADRLCIGPLAAKLHGQAVGDWFTQPLIDRPDFAATIDAYMKMPEKGFDKPFFMGNGVEDTDVPYATTEGYVDRLMANGQPVTFKSYPSDHSGTLIASQADTHPFVKRLFAGGR